MERLAKGLFSRTLALTGIEPVPADATLSPLHCDQGDFGSPWTHRAGGRSRPLATRDQDFRVLDHDRRFGAGFDRREMSAPFRTTIDQGGRQAPLDPLPGVAAA